MWNPLNGHLGLISFILTNYCLIRKTPLFSLYGAPLFGTNSVLVGATKSQHQRRYTMLPLNISSAILAIFMSRIKA